MTKGELARLVAWRLRVLQQAAAEQNVARVCRRFGILLGHRRCQLVENPVQLSQVRDLLGPMLFRVLQRLVDPAHFPPSFVVTPRIFAPSL